MHFTSSVGALALVSLAAAAPTLEKKGWGYGDRGSQASSWASWAPAPTGGYGGSGSGSGSGGYGGSGSGGAPPPSGSASVEQLPLPNGFPTIQNPSSQLTQIEIQAHGTLPNGPPPPSVAADDLTSLRLIAFNEIFEVFYFQNLLNNVTNNVPGYQFQDQGQRQQVIDALTAVVAQEELHALNANGALAHFNAGPIQPCKYKAPVSDFKSAITLAYTFTDVVLGTLGDVQTILAKNSDAGLIRGIASVIGQEGAQNGFYRSLLGKIPSELPFLTASARQFAFSALNQNFVVPGSCPNENTIDLPVFGALTVVTAPTAPTDQTINFSVAPTDHITSLSTGYSVVYINQQNTPIVEPIQNSQSANGAITFSAAFPGGTNEMNGLTIAAVVQGSGPFADVDAVAAATIYGPGLIEIN